MGDVPRLSIADNHICATVQDGLNQLGDVCSAVLIVTVGIDDDVGSCPQREIKATGKGAGQTTVGAMPKHMFDAQGARRVARAIGAAVIHDQDLDVVDAWDSPRNISHGLRQGP